MNTHPMSKINFFDLFFLKSKLLKLHYEKKFPISKDGLPTPIENNHLAWVQPKTVKILAEDISAMIQNCNRKRILQKETPITHIAGSGESEILANRVAEFLNMEFLPEPRNGFWEINGESVAYVCNIISTGTSLYDGVTGVRMSAGNCENVFCGFDFGMKLKEPSGIKIHSLLSIHDLINLDHEYIKKWLKENNHVRNFLRESSTEVEKIPV